jgi:LemA protein
MQYLILISSGAAMVAIIFWIISVRRALIAMEKNVRNAMSQIGVQIFSQCELINSLLDLTNWYAAEECGRILKTMKAGCLITKDSLTEDAIKQEKIIAEAKARIIEVAEGCPDLKSDPGYLKAMDAVDQYEKMIQTSMLIYNDSAARLNRAITMFPDCMISGILGFSARRYFEEGG